MTLILMALLSVRAAIADHYSAMGVIGVPANAGPWSWPVGAEYSWLSHKFPAATGPHSWRFHPGTDGGIVFSNGQPSGALTAEFLMFNQPTTLFSTGDGITIDSNETVNFDNLRRMHGSTIYDLGSGAGVDPVIPLVADITQLLPGENGWQINTNGTYHLIYNTVGGCSGCTMILHFYGTLIPVAANGDINGDGTVNVADILLAERHLQGLISLTPGQIARGDIAPNGAGDGALTVADVFKLYVLALY